MRDGTSEHRHANTRRGTARYEHSQSAETTTRQPQLTLAPSAELVSVTPRRVLRPERLADPDQLRTIAQAREPDVLRRNTLFGIAEKSLRLLDCLPPFLER